MIKSIKKNILGKKPKKKQKVDTFLKQKGGTDGTCE